MSQADKKFFFDMNNFDDEVMDHDIFEEEEEELPPPPPVFTESELEAAKQQAFAEGHAAGKTEVEQSRAQALSNLMQRLGTDLQSLFVAEHEREKQFEREAVLLCQALFEKAFPLYQEQYGFEALTGQLQEVLQSQHGKHCLEIKVSGEYAKGVEAFLEKLKAQNSELRYTIKADDTLPDGSFKIGWKDGGAIYDREGIIQRILGNLNEILAGSGEASHDGRDEDSHQVGALSPDNVQDSNLPHEDGNEHSGTGDNPIAEENDE